jgi:hypothetical protein
MDAEIEYMPPRQFARLIGVSESTLAKKRMAGDGPPYVKVGRSVRYSRDAGLAWMSGHARRSTSDRISTESPRKKRRSAVRRIER